jgi:SAM-dependent methyltransferase
MYEKAQEKLAFMPDTRFVRVVETKSGVVTVDRIGTVYGGGIYDGTFNTDLVTDTNLIMRLFSLSAFHPTPRDVLMIGFSSGSWGQVLVNHPQIEHMTVIEINPGYLELIPTYPQVASLLKNPKLELVIDDGRRWLLRNPDRKFDAIIMNLSYNWRAHMTNLLSVEFLQLVRQHLKPGGVHFYNTTDAGEVFITGLTVFPYGLRVSNFLAVSDAPLIPDKQRWREMLLAYRIDGRPVFDLTRPDHQQRLDAVLGMIDTIQMANPPPYNGMESAESLRQRYGGLQVITDDNMGTEWRCQACGSSPLRPTLPLAMGVPTVPY